MRGSTSACIGRDVERQVESVSESSREALSALLARTKRIITQQSKDKNKLYALHAPEVECIAKSKARKPYEFGVKISITTTHREGLVVGASLDGFGFFMYYFYLFYAVQDFLSLCSFSAI